MNQPTVKERQMSRELELNKKVDQFDIIARKAEGLYLTATNKEAGPAAALRAANIMQEFRQAFDGQILAMIKPMMNTNLGFRTDRDPSQIDRKTGKPYIPYSDDVVRDCCIEAVLKGVQYVGNQFNIIASNAYITQNGFKYLIETKIDGLRWWKPIIGVPHMKNGGAIIECSCTWDIKGTEGEIESEIPVKVDNFTGVDGMLGKARRKFFKRVYEAMTGILINEAPEPEDIEDVIENEAEQPAKETKSTVDEPAVSKEGIQEKVDQHPRDTRKPKADQGLFTE